MDSELRHDVCRLIAGLVVSDDDFAPEEEAFIERMLERFGVSNRDAIFPIVSYDEAAGQMRALPAPVQTEAMSLLIEAAVADGRIADEERAYLRAVGEVVGLDDAALDRRLAEALAARSKA
ncbi:MAG: TerB family tellurite resistance protein [Minicystis sp.]